MTDTHTPAISTSVTDTTAGGTFTPAQLMVKLQVSENTIYWELQHGFLKGVSFRVGRQWRVGAAAFERLMAGGTR